MLGSTGREANVLMSSARRWRKASWVKSADETITTANSCERNFCSAKLQSAGMSLRLVRSPAPPKITMMQASPGLGDVAVTFLFSVPDSSSSSRTRFLPHPKTTYECIRVFTQAGIRRQFLKLLDVSATDYDVVRLQRGTKLLNNFCDMLLPFLSSHPIQATDADVILERLAIPVWQVR